MDIVFHIICLILVVIMLSDQVKIDARNDGEFVAIDVDKRSMDAYYTKHHVKPIRLSVLITKTYKLRLCSGQTITVPQGYVTDGASKPVKWMPIPNDHEGSYWVYHDWMYQRQQFDNGENIPKELADKIMHRLILGEIKTLLRPWKLLYWLIVFFYKRKDHVYWEQLKNRGVAMMVKGKIKFMPKP